MTRNRNTPLELDKGLVLRNRVVVPPMASGTGDETGNVTQDTIRHYQRLAQSQAGLIFVEYTYVSSHGRSEPHQLGLSSDRHVRGLSQVAAAIKETGSLAGIQLTHSGGKSSPALTGGTMWGPSPVAVPTRDQTLEAMHAMSFGQIEALQDDFCEAALRAVAAGFDIVELHCAHGYGINQWLSPITNQRDDGYGGDLEGRSRFLCELLVRMRVFVPEIFVAVRLPGQDHVLGGLTTSDISWLVRHLEELGVGLIDVSSGIGSWRRPRARRGQGYLVEDAKFIKASTNLPVIGVGGIHDPSYIDRAVYEGWIDLCAVGRAILKDPAAWQRRFAQVSVAP